MDDCEGEVSGHYPAISRNFSSKLLIFNDFPDFLEPLLQNLRIGKLRRCGAVALKLEKVVPK